MVSTGSPVRIRAAALAWRQGRLPQGPLVRGPAGRQPQAGHLSVPALRGASARPESPPAGAPRGRSVPPPSRSLRVRRKGPPRRPVAPSRGGRAPTARVARAATAPRLGLAGPVAVVDRQGVPVRIVEVGLGADAA